ncbi:hypothetical protein OEB99_16535 [Actinotalea sp. M2MS4P-6]|uniref:hypothetical protein n=1 Tax=Actinotalea sp. M2MS4P-6 TaxID=2983762 RepID=UPI0021E3E5B9|nr:hypothetical protein [Actinotalea sp. M2MS4P-6]MCV2395924.1 hypothetical protein [Actinotalea sp. M2MS4P-6]
MNPADLHAAVVARLTTEIATISVHDADVPGSPPADAKGRVLPYAVVWGSAGWAPEEARTVDGDAHGALSWPCPVTVAAGDPTWCLRAAAAVRAALDGYLITGAGILREQPGTPSMDRDPNVTPTRWFVPFTFRIGPYL